MQRPPPPPSPPLLRPRPLIGCPRRRASPMPTTWRSSPAGTEVLFFPLFFVACCCSRPLLLLFFLDGLPGGDDGDDPFMFVECICLLLPVSDSLFFSRFFLTFFCVSLHLSRSFTFDCCLPSLPCPLRVTGFSSPLFCPPCVFALVCPLFFFFSALVVHDSSSNCPPVQARARVPAEPPSP